MAAMRISEARAIPCIAWLIAIMRAWQPWRVANFCGVSRMAVYQWAFRGRIPRKHIPTLIALSGVAGLFGRDIDVPPEVLAGAPKFRAETEKEDCGMIRFDPETHTYTHPTRGVIPHVTMVIEDLLREYDGVEEWVLLQAAELGSAVHDAIEFDVEGDLDPGGLPEKVRPYFGAWRRFRDEAGLEIEARLSHKIVYSSVHNYAGTCDLVGRLTRMKTRWGGEDLQTIEVKTGMETLGARLQTAAYNLALREMHPDLAARMNGRGAVYLRGDGSYRYIVHDRVEDVAAWSNGLRFWKWMRAN